MKKRSAGTLTHDYKRHGTTTLFAALDVLEGKVIGRCMQFIRFLNAIEAQVPAGKSVQVVLDNYAARKHPKVRQWLSRPSRFIFHFTPTSCSWLNAVRASSPNSPIDKSSAGSSDPCRSPGSHQPLRRRG